MGKTKNHEEESLDLLEKGDGLNKSLEDVNEANAILDEMDKWITSLADKHKQLLNAYDDRTITTLKVEIDGLQQRIAFKANNIRSTLKTMNGSIQNMSRSERQSAQGRILQQQSSALGRRFMSSMTELNEEQENYKNKCKNHLKRQYLVVNPTASDKEIEDAMNDETGSVFANEMVFASAMDTQQQLEDIHDRHQEILKLEHSIRTLAQLFQDIALLINEQGEMLDRIDNNVESAVDFTEDASKELQQAVKHQSGARKKKIIFGVLVLIIIALIAGGLALYFGVLKN